MVAEPLEMGQATGRLVVEPRQPVGDGLLTLEDIPGRLSSRFAYLEADRERPGDEFSPGEVLEIRSGTPGFPAQARLNPRG
jgi:hypothetical protein